MKKLIAVFGVIIISLCTWVQAQTDTNVNPLNVARAFALKTPTHFDCYLRGMMLVSNAYQWTEIQFVARKSDFGITNLVMDGVQIPLGEPLFGLPIGDGGLIKQMWLNVTAKDKYNKYAGNGYLSKEVVMKNDSLIVTIRPWDIKTEIPLGSGVSTKDLDLNIKNFTYGYGYGPGYGDEEGKFFAYLPPIGGKYEYTLTRRSDNVPVGGGWIEPFKDVVTPNDAYFGTQYEGGVQGVTFNMDSGIEDWVGYSLTKLPCQIPVADGSRVNGVVYFADLDMGNLEVVASGMFDVYAWKATEHGDMTPVALENHSGTSGDWYQSRFNSVSGNLGKIVIAVVPIKDAFQETWVNFHRFYGPLKPPSTSGGGGGGSKGVSVIEQ